MAAAPESASWPTAPPPLVLAVVARLDHASVVEDLRCSHLDAVQPI
jgi:hypothetical protein